MNREHQMSSTEILLTMGDLLEVLKQPDPDANVNRILGSLPPTCGTFTGLLGALAVRAASMTLDIAGIDTSRPVRVELVSNMPADDIPGFAKTAGELVRLGCDWLLVPPDGDEPAAKALNEAAHAAAHRGPESTLLVLGELLGRIRRLQHGDTREVIRG
jgi:hypothetical protein